MHRNIYLIILFVSSLFSCSGQIELDWKGPSVDFNHGKLEVSTSGRYLQHADGTPFLYLADTAWEMLSRLNKDEVEFYLEDRRKKGFTVIQTVIMDELDGKIPDEEYLLWIDTVLTIAHDKGLYLALLPTWGDKVDKQWGKGPEIFNPENAYQYGLHLGERYQYYPNIIWVNGGDRSGEGKNKAVWNALAEGIKMHDQNHLMTYHPQGEHSSSFWFHNEDWLDFNMIQSGHAQSDFGIYKRLLLTDIKKNPSKPVLDAEPRYENIVENFDKNNRRFNDHDIRMTLYQSMFSGACGYTYGCNDIWQMYDIERKPEVFANTPWYEALDFSAAKQMIILKVLFESFDFLSGKPAQSLILDKQNDTDYAVAFKGKDYALFYLPYGTPINIDLESHFKNIKGIKLYWLDPSTGEYKLCKKKKKINKLLPNDGNKDHIAIVKIIN